MKCERGVSHLNPSDSQCLSLEGFNDSFDCFVTECHLFGALAFMDNYVARCWGKTFIT